MGLTHCPDESLPEPLVTWWTSNLTSQACAVVEHRLWHNRACFLLSANSLQCV